MGGDWKREKVQDHKFDFINVDDFVDNSCWRQFRYMLVFAAIIRGILVYCSDIFTAVNLLANTNTNSFVDGDQGLSIADFKINLPYSVYKYLFTACIIFGFILLALDIWRAAGIIKSKDISYAFTSQIASRFYSVRSYPHYCLFAQINNSKKTVDEVAFFCFFTFRNWKRLMLADAPRQVINATILYQTFHAHLDELFNWDKIIGKGDKFLFKKIALSAMIFTVAMFTISLVKVIVAVIVYIPLVSHIRGNLKEFCCHKIDKRIDELIKKNTKDRAMAAMNAQARGKNNKDGGAGAMMKQPTLPQLDLLEGPPPPIQTSRHMYNQSSNSIPFTPRSGNGSYAGQQQGYGYPPPYKTPTQGQGYEYSSDDYFKNNQSPTPQQREAAFDPYADGAFNSDEIYDGYNKEKQFNHPVQRTPSHPMRYEDHGFQRTASPSQHGSDLESNHNGSNHSHGNGGYGRQLDYYPSNSGQRHQRQGTMASRDQSFRNGGGYQ
ncbi:hypothetical protein B0O80DRAFT_471614 [Mortierella sp. GBAus27b]|nr:hypothetical protein B0O80DRAFT_471614 [Mortierella sp. GBAus27b]